LLFFFVAATRPMVSSSSAVVARVNQWRPLPGAALDSKS
jgi:hypothetical protein